MTVHVHGIRHHGPGSARSVLDALTSLNPDMVLVEGPPDAEEVLSAIVREEMKPPVALLVYPTESPSDAVYYPFAQFSPEWVALRFAIKRKVPARFIDLPMTHRFALDAKAREELLAKLAAKQEGDVEEDAAPAVDEEKNLREDPLGMLADAAGLSDRELWWESQVERRRDPAGLFEGIIEAMGALRENAPVPSIHEQRREAYMRTCIRSAEREGYVRIAVICGAWHAPVLAKRPPAKDDTELLRGLPKTKVTSTWIPWTNSRLSYRSGYGAGIESPGWYAHLWEHGEGAAVRWCTKAARLLRSEDLDASSANVIETVRLAEALSGIRDLTGPGLPELRESIQAVLCKGDHSPVALVRERLEIGDELGAVPPDSPAVPLQRDLEGEQKRLRLKPSTEIKNLVLDLRKDLDRDRSRLFHRLTVLGIDWAKSVGESRRRTGTYSESWQYAWRPELAVALIEKNVFGHTLITAASAFLVQRADHAELVELTTLLDQAILAELPQAMDRLVSDVQSRAAVSADVRHLMNALLPLARIARYSDVRETRAEAIIPVLRGLYERILVGLPPACAQLDDSAATDMAAGIDLVHEAVLLLADTDSGQRWKDSLRVLMNRDGVHGLVRGLCCKLLLEQKALADDELLTTVSLALSPRIDAIQAASWIEGLLRGTATTLLHHDEVWAVLNGWMGDLPTDAFDACLPLLRRAFSNFPKAERGRMGMKIRALSGGETPRKQAGASADPIDEARAARTLPLLAKLLGVRHGQ